MATDRPYWPVAHQTKDVKEEIDKSRTVRVFNILRCWTVPEGFLSEFSRHGEIEDITALNDSTRQVRFVSHVRSCLLYTSDAADE